jgi:hypothetical protein
MTVRAVSVQAKTQEEKSEVLQFKPLSLLWVLFYDAINICRGEPTRDGPPAWGLDVGLTTHRKK